MERSLFEYDADIYGLEQGVVFDLRPGSSPTRQSHDCGPKPSSCQVKHKNRPKPWPNITGPLAQWAVHAPYMYSQVKQSLSVWDKGKKNAISKDIGGDLGQYLSLLIFLGKNWWFKTDIGKI